MKSALLHYSYSEVFRQLHKVCNRNGFSVRQSNENNGEIMADRGWKLLGKKIQLTLHVEKVTPLVTKVNVDAIGSGLKKNKSVELKIEEEIVDTIYKYF